MAEITASSASKVAFVEKIDGRDGHTGLIYTDGQELPRFAFIDLTTFPRPTLHYGIKWGLFGIGPLGESHNQHSKQTLGKMGL